MDFKELSQRLELEESEYRELIELFIEISSSDMNTFQLAIQAKNMEQAARSVHSIIGAASNLGLMEVSKLARKIETDVNNNRIQNISESVQMLKSKVDFVAEYIRNEEIFV